LIFAAGHLVLAPLALAKGDILVTISLGALAPVKAFDSLLFVILSKFDLFIIWEIVAAGIGLSAVYGFSRNKGIVLSVISFGTLSLLSILSVLLLSLT
jgi:hypothetical protein